MLTNIQKLLLLKIHDDSSHILAIIFDLIFLSVFFITKKNGQSQFPLAHFKIRYSFSFSVLFRWQIAVEKSNLFRFSFTFCLILIIIIFVKYFPESFVHLISSIPSSLSLFLFLVYLYSFRYFFRFISFLVFFLFFVYIWFFHGCFQPVACLVFKNDCKLKWISFPLWRNEKKKVE